MRGDTIRYPDGTEVPIGDVVSHHGDTLQVEDIVVGSRLAEFGVDTPGLMLVGPPFGRLFLPVNYFEDEDGSLVFVVRQS